MAELSPRAQRELLMEDEANESEIRAAVLEILWRDSRVGVGDGYLRERSCDGAESSEFKEGRVQEGQGLVVDDGAVIACCLTNRKD
jgi:hypothetical protein